MLCGSKDFFERWSCKRLWLFSSWVGFLYNFLLFGCSACVHPKLSSPVYMSRTITDSTTGEDEVTFQVNLLSLWMRFFESECKAYFGIFEAEPVVYCGHLRSTSLFHIKFDFFIITVPLILKPTHSVTTVKWYLQIYFPRVQNKNKIFLHTTTKSSQTRSIFLDGLHYS